MSTATLVEETTDALLDLDGSRTIIKIELELPGSGPMVTVAGVTLNPAAMYMLLAAQDAYGSPILPLVVSSYRSIATQAAMYADRANNSLPVAPPGQSWHNYGVAIDIGAWTTAMVAVLAQFLWIRDVMPADPVHFHYVGPGSPSSYG